MRKQVVSSNSRQLPYETGNYKHERDHAPTGCCVKSARHEEQRVPSECDLQSAASDALIHINDLLEMEVRRIAHALHDEAGQMLTVVHLKLAEIERQTFGQCRAGFVEVRQLLGCLEEQLRQFSHELRPALLDEFGLVPALDGLAASFGKRTGLDIAVIATTRERFPAPLETALYRIVQETLINANRHARARRVTIQVWVGANVMHCTILDDGVGFDCEAARGGLGLLGIRERLVNLSGRLTISSRIGEGTRIAVALPMERR